MPSFIDKLQHAWNAFNESDPKEYTVYTQASSYRPDRIRLTRGNEKTIINSVFNRIALDAASITIQHCKTDENNNFVSEVDSGLNSCLNISANLDQTGRLFLEDVVMTLLDEGSVAIVPIDTSINPKLGSFDILSLRTGKIKEWMPDHVKVEIYNEKTGVKVDKVLSKNTIAIVENPFYSIMNDRNSTLQRLTRKLNILDVIDEQSGAGKLDMIIQLPYVIKTEDRRAQAERRRKDIEDQINNSKLGIAYTDGTEKITQLNRSLDNNLMKQVEYLTNMLYSQLYITPEILNGNAKEEVMMNYYSRTIEPIIAAIVDEMKRKFLTKTARTQRQTILYFRNPFKLVPISNIADIADKFTRNEIMSSNEIRQIVGLKPVNDAKADELRNKNINAADGQEFASTKEGEIQNG